jgi:hypothetical protein
VGIVKYGVGRCVELVCIVNITAYTTVPDNTQHWQQTDIHSSGGIGTRNPSKRSAADGRIRPRGHCVSAVDVLVMRKL